MSRSGESLRISVNERQQRVFENLILKKKYHAPSREDEIGSGKREP